MCHPCVYANHSLNMLRIHNYTIQVKGTKKRRRMSKCSSKKCRYTPTKCFALASPSCQKLSGTFLRIFCYCLRIRRFDRESVAWSKVFIRRCLGGITSPMTSTFVITALSTITALESPGMKSLNAGRTTDRNGKSTTRWYSSSKKGSYL